MENLEFLLDMLEIAEKRLLLRLLRPFPRLLAIYSEAARKVVVDYDGHTCDTYQHFIA